MIVLLKSQFKTCFDGNPLSSFLNSRLNIEEATVQLSQFALPRKADNILAAPKHGCIGINFKVGENFEALLQQPSITTF